MEELGIADVIRLVEVEPIGLPVEPRESDTAVATGAEVYVAATVEVIVACG